jgi:phosphoribosyl-AMP cyclohydrolase
MLNINGDFSAIRFNTDGLVPVVAQDISTGAVLMLAWANAQALQKTADTGEAHYYSRSRKQLWHKGETSGHRQIMREMLLDCDGDSVLYRVEQVGAACHTNDFSCFHETLACSAEEPAPGFEALRREFGA